MALVMFLLILFALLLFALGFTLVILAAEWCISRVRWRHDR